MGRSKAHGATGTRLHNAWKHMIQRCRDPNVERYQHYGGRGIVVCEEWRNFATFRLWALRNGYRPHLQIDRIDNDGPYSPENCRWVTQTENLRNNSHVHYVEVFGERKAMSAWAEDERCAVSYGTFKRRIREGWPPEDALATPPNGRYLKQSSWW